MPSKLELTVDCRFRRPIDVVRAHFLDMRHHIDKGVHKGVHYTILEERGDKCRIRQKFKVLGLTKVDELELYRRRDGAIVQDFLVGDFAGGSLVLELAEDGPLATKLKVTFDVPLRGANRLLKPIIKRTVKKLTDQALEEDRADLEEARYEPSGWAARAAKAAAS